MDSGLYIVGHQNSTSRNKWQLPTHRDYILHPQTELTKISTRKNKSNPHRQIFKNTSIRNNALTDTHTAQPVLCFFIDKKHQDYIAYSL